jgi:hypothetical protein
MRRSRTVLKGILMIACAAGAVLALADVDHWLG